MNKPPKQMKNLKYSVPPKLKQPAQNKAAGLKIGISKHTKAGKAIKGMMK